MPVDQRILRLPEGELVLLERLAAGEQLVKVDVGILDTDGEIAVGAASDLRSGPVSDGSRCAVNLAVDIGREAQGHVIIGRVEDVDVGAGHIEGVESSVPRPRLVDVVIPLRAKACAGITSIVAKEGHAELYLSKSQIGEAVHLLLCLLYLVGSVVGNRPQVGDVVLQRAHVLLIHVLSLGNRSVGSLLGLLGGRLRLAHLLLQLLNGLVPALDLLLQLLYLLLLCGNGFFHVLERFRNRSGTAMAASLRFRTRRRCLCDNARREQNRER